MLTRCPPPHCHFLISTGPLPQADLSAGIDTARTLNATGFWSGGRWYGYRTWSGDLYGPPPSIEGPPGISSQTICPPAAGPATMVAPAPRTPPISKRRKLSEHELGRCLLYDNAAAAVDRWESGALSTIKFNLLAASIPEGKVPLNPDEFLEHSEETHSRLAGMAALSNDERGVSRQKLLTSIKSRDHCSKEKRIWDGHKSALRAFAKHRLAQGERDERLHCAAEIPDSRAVARYEMRMFLEWMFTGGIKFRNGERKLKSCKRYAMSVIQAHGRLEPPIDLTFLNEDVAHWSEAAEMMQIRSVGVTATFEKSAFDKAVLQRLCDANWSDHIRQGKHPPAVIRRLGITLKTVVQCSAGASCCEIEPSSIYGCTAYGPASNGIL